MSQFEYLRSMSIGQYLPLASPVHRLDPRAKLLAYVVLIIAVSLASQAAGLLFALVVVVILMAASRTPPGYALRGWMAALPFLLALAALQLIIVRPDAPMLPLIEVYGLRIYFAGIEAATTLLLRFSVLMALLTVASATLSTLETIHAMDLLLKPLRWIGLNPTPVVMVVQIMLRFLPFLALSAEKIAKSQASRGADWDGRRGGLVARAKRVLPLVIPLFINSLRQAETLADAMLARGFSEKRDRTSLREIHFRLADGAFLLAVLTCSLLVLFPSLISALK
jgi:energy-coupling factor transport system permease protein